MALRPSKQKQLRFGLESLEARSMLSGDPVISWTAGHLQLQFDSLDDDVVVEQVNTTVSVHSADGGASPWHLVDSSRLRKLTLALGGGVDSVSVIGLSGSPALSIEGGVGETDVVIRDAQVGALKVLAPQGPLVLTVGASQLKSSVEVSSGPADFRFTLDDSYVRSWLRLRDAGGNSDLVFHNSSVVGWAAADLDGVGDRQVTLDDACLRSLDLDSEAGRVDVVMAGASEVATSVTTESIAAEDTFLMRDSAHIRGALTRRIHRGDSATVLRDAAAVTGTLRATTLAGHADLRILDQATVGWLIGSPYQVKRNVTYAQRDHGPLRADVYQPSTTGPHPAIVMVHGGFWRTGDRSWMAWEAARLAERGYVVLNIDYRLAPADPFPAQIHDAKSAVYWLRSHAAQFDVDPARIGAYGYSAGAHLALMLGVTAPADGLEGPDAQAIGLQSRVQAVVAGGPPSDFRDLSPDSTQFAYWLGGTPAQVPDRYRDASPAYWVSPNDSPTFLFVGQRDQLINVQKVRTLADQLSMVGVANEVYVVPQATHLSAARNRLAFLQAGRFLDQTLKGA